MALCNAASVEGAWYLLWPGREGSSWLLVSCSICFQDQERWVRYAQRWVRYAQSRLHGAAVSHLSSETEGTEVVSS